jgi:hypothetical protein
MSNSHFQDISTFTTTNAYLFEAVESVININNSSFRDLSKSQTSSYIHSNEINNFADVNAPSPESGFTFLHSDTSNVVLDSNAMTSKMASLGWFDIKTQLIR